MAQGQEIELKLCAVCHGIPYSYTLGFLRTITCFTAFSKLCLTVTSSEMQDKHRALKEKGHDVF